MITHRTLSPAIAQSEETAIAVLLESARSGAYRELGCASHLESFAVSMMSFPDLASNQQGVCLGTQSTCPLPF